VHNRFFGGVAERDPLGIDKEAAGYTRLAAARDQRGRRHRQLTSTDPENPGVPAGAVGRALEGCRQGDDHLSPAVRFPGESGLAAKHIDFGLFLRLDIFQAQALPRPLQHGRIDGLAVLAAGVADIRALAVLGQGPGSIYSRPVDLEPFADLAEALLPRIGNEALAVRPEVEQIVAALGGDVDEIVDEGCGTFPVIVRLFESPAVIGGHAAFPVHGRSALAQDLLLGGAKVAGRAVVKAHPLHAVTPLADAVVDDDLRLQPADKTVEFGPLGFGPFVDPLSVKPEHADLAIAGEEFAQLRFHIVITIFGKALTGGVGMVPVHDGIVKAKADAGRLARIRQLFEHVPFERSKFGDIITAHLRVPHRESVVMFGGDDDVLRASLFGQLHPGFGIKLERIELPGVLFVLGGRDVLLVHNPFSGGAVVALVDAARYGVRSPMDEHAEPGVAPPAHALIEGLFRLRLHAATGQKEADPAENQHFLHHTFSP